MARNIDLDGRVVTIHGEGRAIDELAIAVEGEGFAPGSPQFEVALRAKKVEKCRELRGLRTCEMCPAVLDCSIRLAHLRDRAAK